MTFKNKKSSKEIKSSVRKVAGVLDIPDSGVFGESQIEIISNREASIDGAKGIIQYDSEIIKINLGNKIVCFTGSDLVIKQFGDKNISIKGLIASVDFT